MGVIKDKYRKNTFRRTRAQVRHTAERTFMPALPAPSSFLNFLSKKNTFFDKKNISIYIFKHISLMQQYYFMKAVKMQQHKQKFHIFKNKRSFYAYQLSEYRQC